ncbi:MAG: DNA repair protein RadA [Deltaproteobacteria bacterium]|nr:DNA repair protein RadA [Deltaproteobacteria bacterium]
MAKARVSYVCGECGYTAAGWMGKCPDCGAWGSISERVAAPARASVLAETAAAPVPVSQVSAEGETRLAVGVGELDRVLGGGLVPGSAVLLGGDPGIGKSTLMLQALGRLAGAGHRVLYVSGEESASQVRWRAERLGAVSDNLYVVAEIELSRILSMAEELSPQAVVLDSVQTLYSAESESAPGSVSQVRESAFKVVQAAKSRGFSAFLVGHVTKEGALAGPRILEHMVDTVLYFEGERSHAYRVLRAVKNRFGATDEIGVFEMAEAGLAEVKNPSAAFLSQRPEGAAGSAVAACLEGTRPVLVEIQALASPSSFSSPRRTVLGLDANRVALLAAVLEKKAGLSLASQDLYVNVAGGLRVSETAADLAVCCAAASALLDRPLPPDLVLAGEVGLTGEVRGASRLDARLKEAAKMGFTRCLVPRAALASLPKAKGMKPAGVKTVAEALKLLFS